MTNSKKIWIAAVGALALASCTAAGEGDDTKREDGEVVEGGDVGAFALRVGDCFTEDDGSGDLIDSVPVVPCDETHLGEVFHLFDLPEGDYPGEEALAAEALEGCLRVFPTYVGRDFASSRFDVTWLLPSEGGWNGVDDREIVCVLIGLDGALLTGSAAGSGE